MISFLVSTAIIEGIQGMGAGLVLILHDVSEITQLRKIALQMDRYGEIIGMSEKMKNIFALIETMKHYNTSVLIFGAKNNEDVKYIVILCSRRFELAVEPVHVPCLQDALR